jgi:hypothetical protein
MIDCQATGNPLPRIRWMKAERAGRGDYKPVVSNPHRQVYENGSLAIVEAREQEQGDYECRASNGVSTSISKQISIKVHG